MHFKMSSADCFNLDESKILSFSRVTSLPNDKILDLAKIKAPADAKKKKIKQNI